MVGNRPYIVRDSPTPSVMMEFMPNEHNNTKATRTKTYGICKQRPCNDKYIPRE